MLWEFSGVIQTPFDSSRHIRELTTVNKTILDYLKENGIPCGGQILLPLEDGESIALMHKLHHLHMSFGPGGCALRIDPVIAHKNKTLIELLLMRGVLNENMNGAGI